MREVEKCEMLLSKLPQELENESQKIESCYCMGEMQLAKGNLVGAEEAFRAALELVRPHYRYFYGGVFPREDIQRKLDLIATIPRTPGLRVNWHGVEPTTWTYSKIEVGWGRAFHLDHLRRLCAWDPFAQEGVELAVMPETLCDFVPVDRDRVFVAFTSGIVALYQEGKDRPVWKRDLSLGYSSYLSASPLAITAADNEGMLHALDPASGATLWTRKVRPEPRRETFLESSRRFIRQRGSGVLIPAELQYSCRAVEWLDARTGAKRWSYRAGFWADELLLGDKLLILANDSGNICGVSVETGNAVWETQIAARSAFQPVWTALATDAKEKRIYFAGGDTVSALSSSTGDLIWSWQWKPRPEARIAPNMRQIGSQLCAAEDHLFFIVNWSAEAAQDDKRTDVVVLTNDGNLLLHETSPVYIPYPADRPLVKGMKVAFRKDTFWEVWDVENVAREAVVQP